jgi:hypothetical protein
MDDSQITLLIQAANKIIGEQKTLYDYWVLLLPFITAIISGLLGWFGSSYQNKKNSMVLIKKENYYNSKGKITDIVKLFNEVNVCIYTFYKDTKNRFNSGIIIPSDLVNDFITDYNIKLSFIHQLIRIEFSGEDTKINEIVVQLKMMEKNIAEMNNLIKEYYNEYEGISSEQFFTQNANEVNRFNAMNQNIINEIGNLISLVEVTIIKKLSKIQKELGIF